MKEYYSGRSEPGAHGGRIVMVVEDNADEALLTVMAFRHCPIPTRALVMQDGEEALEYMDEVFRSGDMSALPALIVLDHRLPKINGAEVLRRLRAHPAARHVPVVMLSSSDQDRDIEESYEAGANSYVRKPIEFEQFQEVIRHLGMYWLGTNTPSSP